MAIQTRIVNGSYTEIYAGGGNFITQSAPTNFHQFWTQKILVGSETIEDFREVTEAEMNAIKGQDSMFVPWPQNFVDRWNSLAGAKGRYNMTTGYGELNGVTDITYAEALVIDSYATKLRLDDASFLYQSCPCRTLFTIVVGSKAVRMFGDCHNIEVVSVRGWLSANSYMFANSSRLRAIYGELSLAGTSEAANLYMFDGCSALETVMISHLAGNVSFADSPLLSLESIERIITTARTDKHTILLHPEAYARVTDELFALAAEKNITIATT